MAASVSGLIQAFPFNNNTSTLAAVGGAGAAFPNLNTGLTQNGIDGSVVPESPSNQSVSITSGVHYSLWSGNFPGSASYDLSATNSSLSVHFINLSPGYTAIATTADAVWLILFSGGGTTNYARWHFNGTPLRDGNWHILTAQGTPDATGGTFDAADVTGVGFAIESNLTGGAFGFQTGLDQCVVHEGNVVLEDTGGAATVDLLDYYDLLKATSGQTYHSQLVQIAGTTVEFGYPIDIRADDYDDTATPFGIGFKDGNGIGYKDMPSGFFNLLQTGQASGSQDYGANAVATLSTPYNVDIDASAASTGMTISDRIYAVANDVTITGAGLTLSNVSVVSPAGTVSISDYAGSLTITGVTGDIQWTADLAANASLTTDSDIDITFAETDLSDITIALTGNTTLAVTPTTGSGTYNLSGLTTTGTVTLDNLTANNTTITLPAGTSNTVASPTTGGGTITVDSPATTFTINTNVSALIRIYTNNTQTILDSTTGTSLAFVHSGQTVDYTIEASGYIPQRFTAETLSGTTAVTINLVADPVYNASHGLTFTTDYSYNASTRVMTIVANQEGRNLYSALIDDFQTETAFRNCPFPLTAIGPDRIDFKAVGYYNTVTTVGATLDSGDIQFWKGTGMEWEHSTTGNPTKKFYSIKSSNTLQSGSVVGYTQVLAGTPVEATLVSNQVNQVIQFFEDTNGDGTPDYNYTGHLLFKGFLTGYYQARWDVINDGGVTTLEPYEYNISLTQEAIAGTTGDQAVTITTLTDHTGAPTTVGGKNFDYELVDPGTNTAAVLLAQHNYNVYNAVNTSISGTLYTSYQAFDLPDLLIEAGANIETEQGYFEGDGAVTDLSGVYCSRSAADHPNVTRFQSNDGTYYTPAVTANATGTNLPDDVGGDTRLQIANLTAISASAWQASTAYTEGDLVLRTTGAGTENTAGLFFRCTSGGTSGGTEPTWVTTTPGVFGTAGSETTDNTVTWECFAILLYDADPASTGWSDTYFDGEEFADGETARIRFAHLNGATSFEYGQTTAAVTSSGFSFNGSLFIDADSVYASNAVDGSSTAVTNIFTADYANDEIDLDADLNFTSAQFFAFYCYELTATQGMNQFWGGVTAIDAGNYRINNTVVSLYFDETAGFVRQTDTARIFRADGTRPALDPTTGGNGVEVNWQLPVYVQATGSAVTAQDKTDIIDGVHNKVVENSETFTQTTRLMRAALVGESTVSGTTYTFRDAADSKARITATVDTNGQRTSVTTDGT